MKAFCTMTPMQFVRKFFRGLASYLFKLFILLTAVVAALVLTFHSPKKIEKSLNDSGVYTTFVDSALQEAQKSNKEGDTSNIPTNDPAVKAAAKQAFTPQLLQQSTENVLNGTYAWLSGNTPSPNFKIDLSGAKQNFANSVGMAAAQRVSSLPACTTAQLQQLTTDIDPFSLTCLPPGFDIDAAQNKVTNDIASSKDFLGTPIITPQNLPKNSQGKTVFDQLANAPKIYKWVSASPWLLAILAVLSGGITIALYESRRHGIRNLAISLSGAGIFLLIIGYLDDKIIARINRPDGALGKSLKGSFQQTAIKAVNSISHSVIQVLIWFGIGYLVIGVGALIALHFTKPSSKSKPPAADTNKHDKPEPKPETTPQTPPAPKPRPLVQ